MSRPRLTDDSFLAHVFSPKKNPQPTGLRKTSRVATKGRRKARVNAFNRMTSVKQEILKRADAVEKYLRGEVTFTDAKRRLRTEAQHKGIVKPLRRRYGPSGPNSYQDQTELRRRIADHIWQSTKTLKPNDYQNRLGLPRSNRRSIDDNVMNFPGDLEPEILTWDLGNIQAAAKGYEVDGRRYVVFEDGNERNPFWYH